MTAKDRGQRAREHALDGLEEANRRLQEIPQEEEDDDNWGPLMANAIREAMRKLIESRDILIYGESDEDEKTDG